MDRFIRHAFLVSLGRRHEAGAVLASTGRGGERRKRKWMLRNEGREENVKEEWEGGSKEGRQKWRRMSDRRHREWRWRRGIGKKTNGRG